MCNDRCYIVPAYLLKAISVSEENSEETRNAAAAALSAREQVTTNRHERLAALTLPRGYRHLHGDNPGLRTRQSIVPADLLRHISESKDVDEKTRSCARRDLEHLKKIHESVMVMQQGIFPILSCFTISLPALPAFVFPLPCLLSDRPTDSSQKGGTSEQKTLKGSTGTKAGEGSEDKTETFYRAVYDAKHNSDESKLPGKLMRAEGQKASTDQAVNEAYDNVGHVLKMYKDLFNWNSIDNQNMHVVSSVHFSKNYENACKWLPPLLIWYIPS
jgi:hypothetical protein